MLDEILEMFGRKRRPGAAQPGGVGGLLSRVQGALDGDDDRHRTGHGRSRGDDRGDRFDDHDDHDDHDDRATRRGGRRERYGFDLGDD